MKRRKHRKHWWERIMGDMADWNLSWCNLGQGERNMGDAADYYRGLCVDDDGDWRNEREERERERSSHSGPGLCPECDGETILRGGMYGDFWGCKSFPECKGSRSHE